MRPRTNFHKIPPGETTFRYGYIFQCNNQPRFADKPQIKASAKQQKTIRRNSVSSVTIGAKAFPPKTPTIAEKTLADDSSSELFQIVLPANYPAPKLSESYSNFERLMAK